MEKMRERLKWVKHLCIREENLDRLDLKLWAAILFLCCFGLILVYSASAESCAMSEDCNFDSMYQMKRQLIFMLLGFIGIGVCQHIDFSILYKLRVPAYVLGTLMIFMLKTPLGHSVNGACRWLKIGPLTLQVAEVVKITLIVSLAGWLNEKYNSLGQTKLTVFLWIAGGIQAGLLLLISNDLSSSIVVLGITFGMTFICTKTKKLHLYCLAAAVVLVAVVLLVIRFNMPDPETLGDHNFRLGRIVAWFDPERYDKYGFQTLQALYAIGSGGFLGRGLGNSIQKLTLPEAETDMIFSILCEELGVVGAALLLLLFCYLLAQICEVARASETMFGGTLATGVFCHIALQCVINIAVNVKFFPNTGLPLPFISSGGTSVFFLLMEMAMVFSVERHHLMREVRRIYTERDQRFRERRRKR